MICTFGAYAQDGGFYYGTRLALGESNLESKGIDNSQSKLFWQLGAASAFQLTNNIGITADFLLTGKGAKGNGSVENGGITGPSEYTYDEDISLINGEVPLALKLSYPVGGLYLKAYAGPSINFNFVGTHSRTYDNEGYNNNNGFNNSKIKTLETMSTSFVYGAGVDVKAGNNRLFFLDVRLSQSMADIGTINGEGIQSSFVALTAGYMFK